MDREIKSNCLEKELTSLELEKRDSMMSLTDVNDSFCSRNDGKIEIIINQDTVASDIEEETEERPDNAVVNNKKWYYSPLIPMRVMMLFWFGAGKILGKFLAVFMKRRGLSLAQFSTVFPVIFVFQFLCGSLFGIIADKIGNSKPVLMFLMLTTFGVIVCMVLAPSTRSKSCVQDNLCSIDFGNITTSLSNLNLTCFENDTKRLQFKEPGLRSEVNININITEIPRLCDVSNNVDEDSNKANCLNISDLNSTALCLSNYENKCSVSENMLVTVIYSILILSLFSFWTTTYRFVDVTVMALVKKHHSDFGKERFTIVIAELLAWIVISFVLNTDASKGSTNFYDSVYIVSACGIFLAFLSAAFIRTHINPPGRNLTKKAFKVIRNLDVLFFLFVVFVNGNIFCFNLNFHFWFLEYINAPKILLGLHGLISGIYAIPMLLTSNWWLKNLGPPKIFVLSLLSYSINGFSYSFLYNPWLSLAIEWTGAFSYHILLIAVVVHSHDVAPDGLVATLNVVSGVFHFGFGRSSSVFGGGLLMNTLGPRTTYRIFATASLLTAVLYSIFLYRRRRSSLTRPAMV